LFALLLWKQEWMKDIANCSIMCWILCIQITIIVTCSAMQLSKFEGNWLFMGSLLTFVRHNLVSLSLSQLWEKLLHSFTWVTLQTWSWDPWVRELVKFILSTLCYLLNMTSAKIQNTLNFLVCKISLIISTS
jgi:hypothetical protein